MKTSKFKILSPAPKKYLQVKQDIIKQIYSGDNTDSILLSERELCQAYQVSRPTVRKALNELIKEEILTRDPINGSCKIKNKEKKPEHNRKLHIVVIVSSMDVNTTSYMVLSGIEEYFDHSGSMCVHLLSSNDSYLQYDFSNVDGLITIDPYINYREILKSRRDLPIIFVNHLPEKLPKKHDFVSIDYFDGAYSAVKYLISLGHRKIACITGSLKKDSQNISTVERLKGYKHALIESGLKIDKNLIKQGDWNPASGIRTAKELLSRKRNIPTAIFASNDRMAMGVIRGAMELGYKIPEDLSIVGFDDAYSEADINLTLTTIYSQGYETGQMASAFLTERILSNAEIKNRSILLKGGLRIKSSCSYIAK